MARGRTCCAAGGGADVYLFGRGSEVDGIEDAGTDAGVDMLRLSAGITTDDVTLSKNGNSISLRINGTGDIVTIDGPDSPTGIEQIEFADGTVWTQSQWVARALQTTDGDDYITGFSSIDDYLFGAGGIDTLNGVGGNDTLVGEYLDGGAGNDLLKDGYIMQGGLGNDTYALSQWRETIVTEHAWAVDGTITVPERGTADGGYDVLVLPDNVTPDSVSVKRGYVYQSTWRDSLLLSFSGGSGFVAVQDYFRTQDSNNKVEEIRFADGTVWSVADVFAMVDPASLATDGRDFIEGFRWGDIIDGKGGDDFIEGGLGNDVLSGGQGDDTVQDGGGNDDLDGGAGKDTLFGGTGSDTYRWGVANGSDLIVESGGAAEPDTLALAADVTPDAVSLWRDGKNLVLTVGSNTAQLTIRSYFITGSSSSSSDYKVESIRFSDGTVWSSADIQARIVSGTQNAMTGTTGDDTYSVDDQGDTITEASEGGLEPT